MTRFDTHVVDLKLDYVHGILTASWIVLREKTAVPEVYFTSTTRGGRWLDRDEDRKEKLCVNCK